MGIHFYPPPTATKILDPQIQKQIADILLRRKNLLMHSRMTTVSSTRGLRSETQYGPRASQMPKSKQPPPPYPF